MQFLNSNMIVLNLQGIVVNNAFNYSSDNSYHINCTNITKLNNDFWITVQNPDNIEKSLTITNANNEIFLVTISTIISYNDTVLYFLIPFNLMDYRLHFTS